MTTSPIALLVLGCFAYIGVVVPCILVAGLLALTPRTRPWGRRLAYATAATGPPVVVGVFSVTVLFVLLSVTLGAMGHGTTANEVLAAKVFLVSTVVVAGCGAVAGWGIGWAMGGGVRLSDAIRQNAFVRLLGFGQRGA